MIYNKGTHLIYQQLRVTWKTARKWEWIVDSENFHF